jgi:hypothetical protein
VAAVNAGGTSAYAGPIAVAVPAAPPAPALPSGVTAANGQNQGSNRRVVVTWTDNSTNETGFTIQAATDSAFTAGLVTATAAANNTTTPRSATLTISGLTRNTYYYIRIRANGASNSAWVNAAPFPIKGIVMKDSDEERHREGLYARLFVAMEDFLTPPDHGDVVTFGGVEYTVFEVLADSMGGVTLSLRAAA